LPYTIQKLGYSSRPWRLLRNGNEVYAKEKFDHPNLGMMVIDSPVAADTKTELVDRLLRLLELQAERIESLEFGQLSRIA